MALATKCPHCNTIFRVAHDQLKLRGGIVRCGSCNEVFDGNAALLEPLAAPPAAPSPSPLPEPTPFDQKMAALDTRAAEVLGSDTAEPIYTLELDAALDTAEAEAHVAETEPTTAEPEIRAAEPEPDEQRYDDEPIATTLALPAEPASLPPAVEEALDLDLDLDVEPEPEPEAAPEPAAAIEPQWDTEAIEAPTAAEPEADAEPLEDALSIEAMSDEELEAALAAELAVMEQNIAPPENEAEPASEDAFTSVATDARREPTLDDMPAAAAPPPSLAERFNELDDVDEEALVHLSSAGLAEAQSARAPAHAMAEPFAETESDTETAEAEEPGFIKRDRRRQKFGKAATIVMSLGSLLLVGALAAQGLTTFRNQIAAALPPLKPALTAACNALGCKIELPAQIDDLSIEQGELQTLSDTTFSFTTQLRNQSSTAQAWPHIELVLDDANDKAVLRRVFTPREYLGPDVALDKGFAPHTEQSVKLYFELSQLKASGYHIAVFYP
ncbi:DUF3426 domain-containing protein [Duganella sp. BJB488]|uniref:DUF3426 domain-containing protein n=1 Tax=unclassified Duganella TaxID=2636909 RepID=UPI000E34F57D|nr:MULTISPECIES: DUF3426 domain-containing protein [unclassified Duganella]RFP26335.1 DUF3426 domain-containing protein [Duganella sp. BJB489]RFP27924.1 DUF3426 domain-containing protein [Duganella sp. BJB488]RFP37267.1 DUF3426 domain-containing protein [Duganella sp. BJB480]